MLQKLKAVDWRSNVIYLIFAGIILLFSVLLFDRGFLTGANLMNIARQTAMISIMAVGMTFVLSAEEIDLSFGSVVALSAIVTSNTTIMQNHIRKPKKKRRTCSCAGKTTTKACANYGSL